MTVDSVRQPARQLAQVGDICAARSKLDSMVGDDQRSWAQPASDRRPPAFDRQAMIELRQARGRWSDETRAPAAAGPAIQPVDDDEPIEFVVLDLPAYDATQSMAVRDRAAARDRALRLTRMARRADALLEQLEHEAAVEAEMLVAIDLRDDAIEVIDLDGPAEVVVVESEDIDDVIVAIRRLSALRDQGVLTTPEFDEKMTELLARV